jgi:hypothetical protein
MTIHWHLQSVAAIHLEQLDAGVDVRVLRSFCEPLLALLLPVQLTLFLFADFLLWRWRLCGKLLLSFYVRQDILG